MILEHKKIESLDDYFLELSKRREKGVFFYRINGISDEIEQFLCKYYEDARKLGVIVEGRIGNPTESNLSYYSEIMGMEFKMEEAFIETSMKKWLPRLSDDQRKLISSSIFDSLTDMQNHGKTENMLKNAYVKYMCWLYYKFERILCKLGQEKLPKILYEGTISSYELLIVSILSNAGCDVVLVQKDDDQNYKKLDPSSSKSELFTGELKKFPEGFSIRKMAEERIKEKMVQPVTQAQTSGQATVKSTVKSTNSGQTPGAPQIPQNRSGLHINISSSRTLDRTRNATNGNNSSGADSIAVGSFKNSNLGNEPVNLGPVIRCTNAWIKGDGLPDILESTTIRGKDQNLYYNCYCRINGVVDRLTYANELYQFYISMKNAKRYVVVVNNTIPKPSTDEIMKIKRANYVRTEQVLAGLGANIQYPANPELRDIMVRSFEEVLTEESKLTGGNINKLINKGVYLLCWLKRYQSELFHNWKKPDVGCFIYFGGCKDANEAMFMRFISRLPVDVLILCPNLNERCCLEDRMLYEINHENSMVLKEFPAQNARLHIGTAAYHAERDLDQIMYNDSIVFRDQQFGRANTIPLHTMDREIKILWNTDLKFRPNFSTVDGVVNIPVIFSKMSGVKDGKLDEYWISIKQLITPETLVIDRPPFMTQNMPNPIRMHAAEFFKNGKLQRNRIKSHPAYQYGFLREDMQEHLLDKLDMLIQQRLIKGTFENGTEYTIISVALNLPKFVTRLIQKFDFTKKNPKLIYVNVSETLPSLEDTIYVTFLNLIGFDVIFFVPTGYNIEGHFNKKIMEEHQLGEYIYDLQVPNWNVVPLTVQKNWKDKIFRKG